MKLKQLLAISTDAEKSLEIQHPFMIKILQQLKLDGHFLYLVKSMDSVQTVYVTCAEGYMLSPWTVAMGGGLSQPSGQQGPGEPCRAGSIRQ